MESEIGLMYELLALVLFFFEIIVFMAGCSNCGQDKDEETVRGVYALSR